MGREIKQGIFTSKYFNMPFLKEDSLSLPRNVLFRIHLLLGHILFRVPRFQVLFQSGFQNLLHGHLLEFPFILMPHLVHGFLNLIFPSFLNSIFVAVIVGVHFQVILLEQIYRWYILCIPACPKITHVFTLD